MGVENIHRSQGLPGPCFKSDVFSLGMMLLSLVLGRNPRSRVAQYDCSRADRDCFMVASIALDDHASWLSNLPRKHYSSELTSILKSMLEKDVSKRASVKDLLETLRETYGNKLQGVRLTELANVTRVVKDACASDDE